MHHPPAFLASALFPLLLTASARAGGGGGDPVELDLASLQQAAPDSENDFMTAVTGGDWWLDMRLRYERVDQRTFNEDASALTLRAALGYRTGRWHNLSAMIELEAVQAYVTDYDSLTNGKTQYPVVADPQSGEFNQGYLQWDNSRGTGTLRLGRQELVVDNARFVGNEDWRQNHQSFDAIVVDGVFAENGEVLLAGLYNANTVVGDGAPGGNEAMTSTLSNLSWNFPSWGVLATYAYFLKYTGSSDPRSSSTWGVRFAGSHEVGERSSVSYTAEYASQSGVNNNPNDLDGDYIHAKLGAALGPVDAMLGYEKLGGSSNPGGQFQTPLASLHYFNGWADKFLVTPQDGLQDFYAGLGWEVAKWRLEAVYHGFLSDIGSDDYGSEIDLQLTRPINDVFAFGVKYANYLEADYALADDTQKLWLWLGASL